MGIWNASFSLFFFIFIIIIIIIYFLNHIFIFPKALFGLTE